MVGGAPALLVASNILSCLTCMYLLHSHAALQHAPPSAARPGTSVGSQRPIARHDGTDTAGRHAGPGYGQLSHHFGRADPDEAPRGDGGAAGSGPRAAFPTNSSIDPERPYVFVITPTYKRLAQLADLTRMAGSIEAAYHAHGHNLFWVLVEDSEEKTELVTHFLQRLRVPHAHLNIKGKYIRGTFKAARTRNAGIRFVALNPVPVHPASVLYFADDDNAYDPRLWGELARVRRVGVLPVAYSGGRRVEYPVIRDGRVADFVAYRKSRPFPVDMAGMGINIRMFRNPDRPLLFQPNAPGTMGETLFLESTGMTRADLEPLADNCTKVLVWHLKTLNPTIKKGTDKAPHIIEA